MKTSVGRAVVAAAIAMLFVGRPCINAQIVAENSGSLGSAGDGVHTAGVIVGLPGAVSAGGDATAAYVSSERTLVQYHPALNPASSNPFTIEFWAKPAAITDDAVGPSPLFNRVTAAPRSGWVFFQRSPATGWNFRMYDGNGTDVGFSVEGGSNALDTWSHVVAVWNGTAPLLYVDGALADSTSTGSGIYNASSSAIFSIGSYDDGNNPFNGAVDEVAFYSTALTPLQISAHYNAATSPIAGAYSSLVLQDGAVEYLQNGVVPEPSAIALAMLAGLAFGMRRGRCGEESTMRR